MPYETNWENKGVTQRFWGNVSSFDLKRSALEIHRDRRFDDLKFVLLIFIDVQSFDVTRETAEDIHTANIGAQVTNPNIRVAIVATNEKVIELAALASNPEFESYPTRIFGTLSDARRWLSTQP